MIRPLVTGVLALSIGLGFAAAATACPFCAAQSQTLCEEIKGADVAAIGRLMRTPKPPGSTDAVEGVEIERLPFAIEHVIKGQQLLGDAKQINTIYFGQAEKGTAFLMLGYSEPQQLAWTSPIVLSPRGVKYVLAAVKLPEKGADRLAFFQDYLEDQEENLARDAYDEFATSSYDDVKALRPRMKFEQIIQWINNPDVPASRRGLYFTLLSVCGSEKDLPMLEGFMRSDDKKKKAALDSMINCYLTLAGERGMPLVEELFLKNEAADYVETYAAIQAIRFQGEEGKAIERPRLVLALRHVLKRPRVADLVIPDLARWEDWTVMPELVELFKMPEDKSGWVRVPVINYLKVCPKPEAKQYLEELAQLDPESIRRANSLFPFGVASPVTSAPKNDSAGTKDPPAAARDQPSAAKDQPSARKD